MNDRQTDQAQGASAPNVLRRAWVIPFSLAGWILVFGGGVVIDTAPYRQRLENLPVADQARNSEKAVAAATAALNSLGHGLEAAGKELTGGGNALKASQKEISDSAKEEPGSAPGTTGTTDVANTANVLPPADRLMKAGERLSKVGDDLAEAAEVLAEAEKEKLTVPEKVWYWLVILLCFTPTNVAILCCFAGLLGAGGDQVHLGRDEDGQARVPTDQSHPFLSAVTRSFCVYLLVVSGTIIVMANPFVDPSQEFYVRRFRVVCGHEVTPARGRVRRDGSRWRAGSVLGFDSRALFA